MTTTAPIKWRSSKFYDGDVAWFNGVLYRIKMITYHKYEVAYGGHFYRQWKDIGTALSRAEAVSMCTIHAEENEALPEDEISVTED